MTKNTAEAPSSSIPDFMVKAVEAAEAKKTKAEKLQAREEEAQLTDEMEKVQADIVKATNRLKELADYLGKIEAVVKRSLPSFTATLPLGTVLDVYIAFETQLTAAVDAVKLIGEQATQAREVMLPERLDAEDTRTVNAASGARMTRTTRVLASIAAGCQDEAFAWLRRPVTFEPFSVDEEKLMDELLEKIKKGEDVDPAMFPKRRPAAPWIEMEDGTIGLPDGLPDDEIPDYGSLIKPTVNSSSLSALVKELLGTGKEMPEAFKVHTKDGVSITKAKEGSPATKAKKK